MPPDLLPCSLKRQSSPLGHRHIYAYHQQELFPLEQESQLEGLAQSKQWIGMLKKKQQKDVCA